MGATNQRKANSYKFVRFAVILLFMLSIAQNVDLYLKYNRLQELYIECAVTPEKNEVEQKLSGKRLKTSGSELIYIPQAQAERVKERAINKEYQNISYEVIKDLEKKVEHLEK